ncbi:MAG: ABC transporter ATP-binding protein [Candidatus Bathyarchaeota archaeon]|nr:ABC transporter ATP-binding protein [Candidatus Bathyarchaeota archaeon]
MPSVRLVNVTKRFGKIAAINDLDLEIKDGEYLCVLGPTGSGKTTFLRLIAGILKLDEGEIYIDGKRVNDISPQERNTAYVPQHYTLFPHLSAIENVAFGPLSREHSRKEAYETSMKLLEMMRLGRRADSFPNELSGGMQQRLALARGLASDANLLLLDEPLGALDARLRVELRYKLREWVKKRGFTAIHVTHDQEEAMVVGDRVAVLRHGRIQQVSIPFTVYNEPKTIFVANFVGGANFLEGFIAERNQHGSWVHLRNHLIVRIKETGYSPEERVVLAVREEMTEVTEKKEKKEETNLFSGTVESTSFLGSFILYEIMLENGDVVNSKIPVYFHKNGISNGDKVYVRIQPESIKTYLYPQRGLFRELEVM